jgi:hypothetical protein
LDFALKAFAALKVGLDTTKILIISSHIDYKGIQTYIITAILKKIQ